jgi:hypothetical protein
MADFMYVKLAIDVTKDWLQKIEVFCCDCCIEAEADERPASSPAACPAISLIFATKPDVRVGPTIHRW